MSPIQIHPEIQDAIKSQTPIVALETAVVTHGLPRQPLTLTRELTIEGWNDAQPANLELARAMSRSVRAHGAVPAMIAIINGTLTIGLDDDQLIQLASDANADKASITSMASIITRGGHAGTTVSATLAACALTHSTNHSSTSVPSGIRFFATGGIGGVHRNWQQLPDISADLRALATTAVCVVCSGAKSILDLPATLEMLESLGVPVVGYRTNCLPQFQCTGDESLETALRAEDESATAKLCAAHWSTLNFNSAVLLANPVPKDFAMNPADLERAIHAAESLAVSRHITGPARTPFLLEEIAKQTRNKSLFANLALLVDNAKLAARVARAYSNS